MEIEAKFRVDDQRTFAQLLGLNKIGSFRLEAVADAEDQRNVYFDTADHRLRAGLHGLRVRDLGTRRIATLKGAARVEDGLFERDEWEVEVGDDDRPQTWPPSEVRERVLALIGDQPLQPILSINTLRRHINAFHDDRRIAELSLDEGTFIAGGREQAFRELEIELVDTGTRADFEQLVALLRDQLSLVPEHRSKLARGLELLEPGSNLTDSSPQ
jgi:triphosphatase